MALHRTDVEHLRSVFMAVENGDIGMLKSLGIRVTIIVLFSISNDNSYVYTISGFRIGRREILP